MTAVEAARQVQVAQLRRIGDDITTRRNSKAGFFAQDRLVRLGDEPQDFRARLPIGVRQEVADPGIAADQKRGRVVEGLVYVGGDAQSLRQRLKGAIRWHFERRAGVSQKEQRDDDQRGAGRFQEPGIADCKGKAGSIRQQAREKDAAEDAERRN